MSIVEPLRAPRERLPAGTRVRAACAPTPRAPLDLIALVGVLALSATLECVRLSQNGYANIFYSAAVKSMLRSLHNFLYVSADPNGLITVDKPPLALWLQALSAKVFGFSPLSLLLPEALCAVAAVAVLYFIVAPRFGAIAGLLSALALAVFPSFVAVGRDNGVDPLLILLMLCSCWVALVAIESGRLRTLIAAGVLLGLAFETKSLAALLCAPGIAVAYLACAPGSRGRRLRALVAAGAVFLAVAAAWPLFVDATPSSQRPFVGGSGATNSELALAFGYNGFGRVAGQPGGPGTVHTLTPAQLFPLVRPGVTLPPTPAEEHYFARHPAQPPRPPKPRPTGRQRLRVPIPFAGAASPLRIFGTALGDQAGWEVPLALLGMIAIAVAVRGRWRDRRTALLIVLGGWMVVELGILDFAGGIVHPYYSSALAPGVAAMIGAGAVVLASLLRRAPWRWSLLALGVAGIAGTLAVQLILMARESYPLHWRAPLVAIVALALVAFAAIPRARAWALAVAVAALLVTPAIYSTTVWLAPVNGTFPVAGPWGNAGYGGYGVSPGELRADRSLLRYLAHHGETQPYPLLTESSNPAAPLILMGLNASSEGGYGAADQALGWTRFSKLVAAGRARYMLLEGPWALRKGNGAAIAARLVCTEVPQILWGTGGGDSQSLLVDCHGRAAQLAHPYRAARAFLRAHPKVHYQL